MKLEIFPNFRGENLKKIKPPPSLGLYSECYLWKKNNLTPTYSLPSRSIKGAEYCSLPRLAAVNDLIKLGITKVKRKGIRPVILQMHSPYCTTVIRSTWVHQLKISICIYALNPHPGPYSWREQTKQNLPPKLQIRQFLRKSFVGNVPATRNFSKKEEILLCW